VLLLRPVVASLIPFVWAFLAWDVESAKDFLVMTLAIDVALLSVFLMNQVKVALAE
jgi:hypothetical protein